MNDKNTTHVDLGAMGSGAEDVDLEERRIEPVVVSVRTRVCSVIGSVPSGGEHWELESGGSRFSAAMLDWRFQERIERGDVVVEPGDLLVCRIQVVDWKTVEGIAAEHEIVEVRDHCVPERRVHMPTLPAFT